MKDWQLNLIAPRRYQPILKVFVNGSKISLIPFPLVNNEFVTKYLDSKHV